ncbi:MAG TPA: glycosyltransferase family 4 protein [Anaerolineales bacterium]|nr:glycosyltransferase family 4 protein [Anaerolineales bacterium]
MHVGFLSPEYVLPGRYDGGLANYIYKTAHALISRGQRVTVFVLSDQDRSSNDGQVKVMEVKRVQTALIGLPGKPAALINALLPALDQIRSSRRIAHFVWKEHHSDPFDVLQTSSFLVPGFTMRKNGRIPLVCRISSYSPVLRSSYGRPRNLPEYLCDWLELRQIVDSEAIFSPSQFCLALLERLEAVQSDLLRTPVDFARIEPDASLYEEKFAGARYLLFFGILSRTKGVDLIADAIPDVLALHPDIHFAFVGRDDGMPGGLKMKDFVLSRCQAQKEHIHFLPAVPKPQLYSIIAHAVGVLMPSRVDNYPNACLEAQMLGTPVIGSRNSSLDEMIEDGRTGFLVENGNSRELGEAINRLLGLDEGAYRAMQQANLAWIDSLGREDRIGQLIHYYEDVIRRFNGRQ